MRNICKTVAAITVIMILSGCQQNQNTIIEKRNAEEAAMRASQENDILKQRMSGMVDLRAYNADVARYQEDARINHEKVATLQNALERLKGEVKLTEKMAIQLDELLRRYPGASLKDNRLLMPGDLLFASGQFDLKPESKTFLTSLTQILNSEHQKLSLMIVGHTDSDPIRNATRLGVRSNLHLSMLRAMSVQEEMIRNGYPQTKLYATGWGELYPRAPNDTPQNKSLNRRVEIYIDPAMSGITAETATTGIVDVSGTRPQIFEDNQPLFY